MIKFIYKTQGVFITEVNFSIYVFKKNFVGIILDFSINLNIFSIRFLKIIIHTIHKHHF